MVTVRVVASDMQGAMRGMILITRLRSCLASLANPAPVPFIHAAQVATLFSPTRVTTSWRTAA